MRAAKALAVLAALASASPALGHEVLHEVRRGRAVAVRSWYPDGESLAYVQAEVFSPADARVPHWKGRTDRNGWLAFVPDVPGKWRVRIVDATGHGLDTAVDVAAPIETGASADAGGSGTASFAFALRPIIGVAVIAAIFGLLLLRGRKRAP